MCYQITSDPDRANRTPQGERSESSSYLSPHSCGRPSYFIRTVPLLPLVSGSTWMGTGSCGRSVSNELRRCHRNALRLHRRKPTITWNSPCPFRVRRYPWCLLPSSVGAVLRMPPTARFRRRFVRIFFAATDEVPVIEIFMVEHWPTSSRSSSSAYQRTPGIYCRRRGLRR